jgi:hypothetical protein
MNDATERESLLRDVLAEGRPGEFKEAMLAETLRVARRRRVCRRARSVSAVLALLGIGVFFGRRDGPAERRLAPRPPASYVLVRTQPMVADSVIHTRPLEPSQLVESFSGAARAGTAHDALHLIGDRELLALISPRPAVLIRFGSSSAELEFANAEDRKVVLTE